MFLTELCDLIEVAHPNPAIEDESRNAYVFERRVPARHLDRETTSNFIDLYKRGCFVLEAKQSAKRLQRLEELKQLRMELPVERTGSGRRGGAQWDALMRNAREQAEMYAKRLPSEEGWPPFLIVVDVGHMIELFADFSLQGKHYAQFPDRQTFRIRLGDLRSEAVRERLRLIWTDPQALNPARRTAEVTREVAELLAKLSVSLETRMIRALPKEQPPEMVAAQSRAIAEKVALFLMRCLFTMFAEDIGLLARAAFSELLKSYVGQANKLHISLERLWRDMDRGGFSPDLRGDVLRFNGGLFRDAAALEITEDDLSLLIIAAIRNWKDVEPAIFGTLLERALDPSERHRLGAHYTPRAYVERLVAVSVIEPLAEDWRNTWSAAARLMEVGDDEKARELVREFHQKLCGIRVLDPACGTGNFLYVSMELMKRLEGEVIETLVDLGDAQANLELDRHTVDPHQFLGLEVNPRAVAIAELVLWIGYLQWHFRTRGRSMPAQPVLKNFANIQEQDAVLTFDNWDVLRDEDGRPVTRWDGVTYTLHPITGEQIPDENARSEMRTYLNPRPAIWPEADFVIGNPPFIGNKRMIRELGEGYVNALRLAYRDVPKSVDYVMYWWEKAAIAVRAGKLRDFGLITTNSITQPFNRRLLERHVAADKNPLSIIFATANHPWVRSADKAAVRIAMTTCKTGNLPGLLMTSTDETDLDSDDPKLTYTFETGRINSDLTIGSDVNSTLVLRANEKLAHQGVILVGEGFRLNASDLPRLSINIQSLPPVVRPYKIGRDLTQRPQTRYVVDFYGLNEDEARSQFPMLYQYIRDRVKPERDQKRRKNHREKWWVFGEPRSEMRKALIGQQGYIATCRTAKHRVFQFEDSTVLADAKIICIAIDDPYVLAILSSAIHISFSEKIGARLGVGDDPNYNHSDCFGKFPFPNPEEGLKDKIRALGVQLDSHRKNVLKRHPHLTMTDLYNVLHKVRNDETLEEPDKAIYEAGLVGVLSQIHRDIDQCVIQAYGWPLNIKSDEILSQLVVLNHLRAAEEQQGLVRWLRPDFQAGKRERVTGRSNQIEADLVIAEGSQKRPRLPNALHEQVAAVRALLAVSKDVVSAADVARQFAQGRRIEKRIEELLVTLTVLGQVERVGLGFLLADR